MLAGAGILVILGSVLPVAPVAAATDKLPDLRVARMADFRIERTSGGRRLLRFSGMMLNTGRGPLEVRGSRASLSKPWVVDQVVYQTGGTTRRIHTTATMRYAGDGHNHWHIRRILSYHLWSGAGTTRDAKIGFCFFDTNRRSTSLPGAPTSRKYSQTGCGTRNSLSTRTGISVGWADLYPANFAYQWIDITGLPAGTYTVRAAVDLYHQFAEVSETNNCAYARISFKSTGSAVKVLSTGTKCLTDGESSGYAADIKWASGLISNCDADMFCPYSYVTREQVARALARALDLPAATEDFFTDDNGTAREADINRVAAAGLMTACGTRRFCPTGLVSRRSLATFFVRALELPPTDNDYFTDDETSPNEADINAAVAAGIMNGCGTTTFCPSTAAKRGQTTRWLHHAFSATWPPPAAASASRDSAPVEPDGPSDSSEELIPDWPAGPAAALSSSPGALAAASWLECAIPPGGPVGQT